MIRPLISAVLCACALGACAAPQAVGVGTTSTTSATVTRAGAAPMCTEPQLSCSYDSDCCSGMWCIRGACE